MMSRIDNVRLSSSVTVAKYRMLEVDKNRDGLANFIQERFTERYISPLRRRNPSQKNGFCIMAICCLMIEAPRIHFGKDG